MPEGRSRIMRAGRSRTSEGLFDLPPPLDEVQAPAPKKAKPEKSTACWTTTRSVLDQRGTRGTAARHALSGGLRQIRRDPNAKSLCET